MTRRMHLVAPTVPAPGKPSWEPVTLDVPGWMKDLKWQGAADPVPASVPRYIGPSRLRRKINDALIAQYGKEAGR